MRILVFIVIFFIFCYIKTSFAADAISPNQNLSDNGETLISSDESFELGFFSTSNSSNDRYVGIWFKKIIQQQTIVWVANRDSPIKDSSGVLTVTSAGNIVILSDGNSTIVWSSNSSTRTNNPTLQLLNSGNLVVKHGDSESFAWQSFDHPCDTQLPGMKLGMNFQTGQRWILNSWKSLQDPSTGDFTYQVDPLGVPQLVLRYRNTVSYRSGPWDGERFGGDPKPRAGPVFTPIFVFNSTHLYYTFENSDSSVISRFVVNQSGSIQHFSWNHRRNEWVNILTIQLDQCDTYAKCGPYGICTPLISPTCQCPLGFSPKIQQDWASRDFQGGCVKRPPLNCSDASGFRKFSKMKLPDNSRVLNNSKTSSLDECKNDCLRNCSCVAYARTEASGCVVWFEDLIDIKQYGEFGQDLYIKVAASEADSDNHNNRTAVIVSVAVISGIALLAFISYLVIRRRRISKTKKDQTDHQEKNLYEEYVRDADEEDLDLPYFDLETITTATDNFSLENKIGEGGFGSVYKGVLPSEQEIAVKRLSKDSGQGLTEFKNEVILISKLQHRNLVRLLGCCIHREERMLVYEYMPNRSLDFYLFDKTRSALVNWKKRFEIIIGIARGLLYLHRDSRLRIIHRDLKASNILLDLNMSPKISDFGLARTFGADQTEANTLRIIGTYGYMSPEYAIDGQFSEKSDVFSFGVLVLEIVSGKKNRGFNHPDHDMNLLGHAWKLWSEGRSLDLVDPSLDEAFTASELLKCLQVGLLCVQQRPEDRPTMSSTLLMLDSENSLLSQPKQPGFYTERFFADKDSSSTGNASYASNEITMSMLQGR